ncbi:MAG: response regulator transcription factor [Acidobacteria bacterium]|nr:response regulator transcription factor [Acidobacteriota bacterium]
MSGPRILIVDDDTELSGLLRELLTPEGYEVDTHPGGADAARTATAGGYGLVILDVMLPEVNGFDVLREIRRSSDTPVILLTARGDDVDRIVGLEIGADDYLPKPFNPRELTARIRAVLRRTQPRGHDGDRIFVLDDVVVDPGARSVSKDHVVVDVTTVEFDILRMLVASAGQVVARDDLSQAVLGRELDPFDRSIDMHISKLRRKLGDAADGSERIKTVRGVGYIYARSSGRS